MSDGEMDFVLHPQLAKDSLPVSRMSLCDLLLVNDSRYVWCLLVPRLSGLRDFHDVPRAYRGAYIDDIDRACQAVQAISRADKINVASLGNQVDQLHIHVIARHRNDASWPGPVWGAGRAVPFTKQEAIDVIDRLRSQLSA